MVLLYSYFFSGLFRILIFIFIKKEKRFQMKKRRRLLKEISFMQEVLQFNLAIYQI